MAKPITLLTGEPLLVDQEISKWTSAFRTKYGAESIFVFAQTPLDTRQMIETMTWGWLFASKSCIIIHGLPLSADDRRSAKEKTDIDIFTEWFVSHHESISPDNIVMFVSHKPDKRGKLYKLFDKAGSDSNLGIISREATSSTVIDLISTQVGQRCNATQCRWIEEQIGNNLYRVWHETTKVSDYIQYHQLTSITNNQLNDIIIPRVEQDSFAVIDAVLYKSPAETLALIDRLQQVDDNPYGFLWLLYRWLKATIMVIDAMNQGTRDSKAITAITKLSPYVASKIIKNYSSIKSSLPHLRTLFHTMIDLEYQIKTGQLPVDLFWSTVKVSVSKAR